MKSLKGLFLMFFIPISSVFAQKQVLNQVTIARNQFKTQYFSPFIFSSKILSHNNTFLQDNSVIQFDANVAILNQIENTKPAFLNFSIPTSPNNSIDLELIPFNIFSETYKVLNAQNQEIGISNGVFYKGIIKGDNNSLVSMCFVNGEISGIISNEKGNFILGKLKNTATYVYYNDKDLANKSNFECQVVEDGLKKIIATEVQNTKWI